MIPPVVMFLIGEAIVAVPVFIFTMVLFCLWMNSYKGKP